MASGSIPSAFFVFASPVNFIPPDSRRDIPEVKLNSDTFYIDKNGKRIDETKNGHRLLSFRQEKRR